MDLVLKGPVLVEERDGGKLSKISTAIASERSSTDTTSRPSSSNTKDSISTTQDDRLESTKAEMGEVREENERLKTILAQIVEDYQSLQMHFFDIVKQEHVKKPIEAEANAPNEEEKEEEEEEEPELVSLSLGTSSSGQLKKEEKPSKINPKEKHELEEGLSLALDCKFEGSSNGVIEPITSLSPENSFNEAKEEEAGEPWPPSKTSKNLRNSSDDVSQPPHAKKARVSVRARCDAPTMNDGCQWRKYGQKIAKGNPCPRAYYRCTVAPACPVRKQVQRCAEDMSILITTYEGTHNHPLPISATAMASTTSAAACMLTAGSSASRAPTASLPPSAASNSSLTALNFGLTDNSKPTNFYLPSTCMTPSPSNPTITLDLTAPSPFSSNSQQFNRFSSSFTSNPTYSSSWSSGYSSNYGAQSYNTSQFGSLSLARQAQSHDPSYRPYLNKLNNQPHSTPMSNSLTDTIAKAITSDPSFQSALASAITSYVGSQGTQSGLGQGGKLGEVVPYLAAALASNGCGSTFLTRTDSLGSNTKQANMTFSLQPSLGFSGSKSASTSSVETREKIN